MLNSESSSSRQDLRHWERPHLAGLWNLGFAVLAAEQIQTPEARKMRALPLALAVLLSRSFSSLRAAIVIGLLSPLCAFASWREAPLPPVILITVDTLRADHFSGPGFEHLAANATLYENVESQSPLTLPSHASLLTGHYPFRHGVRDNVGFALAAGQRTWAELLKENGYRTAAFLSSVVLDADWGLNQGFDRYDADLGGRPERPAAETLRRAEDWLASQSKGPLYCWIHLYDPHSEYRPPAPHAASYAGEVEYVSSQLQAFWKRLEEMGLYEPSLIVLTSDHGEALGQHKEPSHGFFLYQEVLRVPLAIKQPGQEQGDRDSRLARLIDVLPTVRQILGLQGRFDTDGRSLLAPVRPSAAINYSETLMPRLQFHWSELRSYRKQNLKYIHAPRPELYDLEKDPSESHNLFEQNQALAAALGQELLDWISSRQQAAPVADTAPPIDSRRLEMLASLGYTRLFSAPRLDFDLSLPDPKDKVEIYAGYLQAMSSAEQGKLDDSNQALEQVLSDDPSFFQGRFLMGVNKGKQGLFLEAIEQLRHCLRLAPDYVFAENKLVLAYEQAGLGSQAGELLQKQIERDPDNFIARHNWAVRLQRQGQISQAIEQEKRALELHPEYMEAWSGLGALYLFAGNPEQAVEALQRATGIEEYAPAYYNLRLAYSRLGQLEKAAQAERKACSLDARYCERN